MISPIIQPLFIVFCSPMLTGVLLLGPDPPTLHRIMSSGLPGLSAMSFSPQEEQAAFVPTAWLPWLLSDLGLGGCLF